MAKLRKKIKIGDGFMTAILIALLFVVIYAVRAMRDYLTILEARAAIEGVELDG